MHNGFLYKSENAKKLQRHINATIGAENVFDFTNIKNKHNGETAYILAPGPTLSNVDPQHFDNKLVIAINSAGFWHKPTYWAITEASYAAYLEKTYRACSADKITLVATIRAAYYIDKNKETRLFDKMYITRFRGIDYLPIGKRCNGETILSAIGLAEWMGCKRCYIFGLDLGMVNGACYVDGIPPKTGSKSYSDQIIALKKYNPIPGLEVINVNKEVHKFPFETISLDAYKCSK